MQRPVITFPHCLFRALRVDWHIDWRGQPGRDTASGLSKTVFNAFPRWVGTPTIALAGDNLRRFKAVIAEGQGRVGLFRVPMWEGSALPPPAPSSTGVPFANGVTFADGATFAWEPFCTASRAAARGATEIEVSAPAPYVPLQGQILSVGDWPFRVTSVWDLGSDLYRLSVQMPLRAAIAANDPVMLRPYSWFELADDMGGRLAHGRTTLATTEVAFREVLRR